jgi:hypothetical protein
MDRLFTFMRPRHTRPIEGSKLMPLRLQVSIPHQRKESRKFALTKLDIIITISYGRGLRQNGGIPSTGVWTHGKISEVSLGKNGASHRTEGR